MENKAGGSYKRHGGSYQLGMCAMMYRYLCVMATLLHCLQGSEGCVCVCARVCVCLASEMVMDQKFITLAVSLSLSLSSLLLSHTRRR